MTNSIILKKSSVADRVPTLTDLAYGELALNYTDGALYYKRSDNTIQNLITAGGGGTGSGSVTSVGLTVPTGLSVAGSPVVDSGIINITLQSGYSIPTTSSQANWNTAYGWGDHAAIGYLTNSSIGTAVQSLLVSSSNIKTINGANILGSGDLSVSGMVYPDPYLQWIQRSVSKSWRKVCSSADGTKLYAIVGGALNTIWFSTDSGANWTQSTAGSKYWIGISCSADGTVVLAAPGGGEKLYISTDSGSNWSSVTSSTNYSTAVAVATNSVFAYIDGGVYLTTNGGSSWSLKNPTTPAVSYTSVCLSDDGTKLFAVALNRWVSGNLTDIAGGYIYTSSNGGTTWTQSTSLETRKWSKVVCSRDGTIVAALAFDDVNTPGTGYVYVSKDSGVTWALTKTMPAMSVLSISMSDDGSKVVILPSTNEIYSSKDYGITWGTIVPDYAVNTSFYSDVSISGNGKSLAIAVSGKAFISRVPVNGIPVIDNSGWATSLSPSSLQPTLISGTSIKTVNGTSLLGTGDLVTGTVTSVAGAGTVSGLTLTGTVTSSGSLTLGGTLTLTSTDITTGLGFTPYNANNPSGYITSATAASTYQPLDADLTSIAALAGTTGVLKKTAANTWALDTSTYLISTAIGSTVQAYDADLTSIAALTGTSGFLKTNGAGTWTVDTSTYLTTATAASTYLTTATAASTYLTTATAASTYLTTATASSTYQPLDADLTNIAALAGTTGVLKKTAANTWALDTSTYLISTAIGSTVQAYDADLSSIAALTGTSGFLKTNGAGTWTIDTSTYLTTTTAASTYLTTATAASTYQPLSSNLNGWSAIATSIKQDTLVSGTNIKTINGTSLLGSGDIVISGGSGGSGTVTSIGISVPTGLSVVNTPVTTSGTIAITLTSGYSIPTTADQTNWSTAYGWGNHASAGYQSALVSGTNIKTINGTSLLGSGNITITGGGGGGTGVTNTVVTATTQTAENNTRYILTNVATSTLTLPATPSQGDTVYVLVANNLLTNVIARNSENIMGVAEDLTIDNPVASFGLIYINSTLGWRFL